MALQYLYQGKQIGRDRSQSTYKQTLYGSLTQIDSYIANLTIGSYVQGKGYLRSWNKTQKQANIWQVEVEYTISYDSDFTDQDETTAGRKSAQLSARNLQLPLETLENYLTNWNHYLIGLGAKNQPIPIPSWWQTATDVIIDIDQREKYAWIKSLGQLPLEKDENGKYWQVLKTPQKAGIEYYERSIFVVTISAKYRSPTAAGNSIGKNINTITSPPEDFGLGGQWKYDQATVSYDGKSWIATSTYSRAVDYWDQDLYP